MRLSAAPACPPSARLQPVEWRVTSRSARCLRRQERHAGPLQALHRDDLPPVEGPMVQEVITFITSEGVVKIPGRQLPAPEGYVPLHRRHTPLPSWEEQSLCIGATFDVSATNGHDPARRLQILGFCQSVDLLSEAVEEAVASRGGEVLWHERELKSGVHEKLRMTVCVPFLWGVPPEAEALSAAIASSGGIVDRIQKQWGIYRPLTSGSSAGTAGITGTDGSSSTGAAGGSALGGGGRRRGSGSVWDFGSLN